MDDDPNSKSNEHEKEETKTNSETVENESAGSAESVRREETSSNDTGLPQSSLSPNQTNPSSSDDSAARKNNAVVQNNSDGSNVFTKPGPPPSVATTPPPPSSTAAGPSEGTKNSELYRKNDFNMDRSGNNSENSSESDRTESENEGMSDAGSNSSSGSNKGNRKKANRCQVCRKKVGLTGFMCRCGGLYCSVHRYSDKHDCTFNYRELGAEEIRKNNPVVLGEKIHKI